MNGITIILNRPSRFDKREGRLFTAVAGGWFREQLGKVGIDLDQCHITTASENNIHEDTKTLLLLGDESLPLYKADVNLGEQRGSPFIIGGKGKYNEIPVVCSYSPQDAFDPKNYESTLNPAQRGEDLDEKDDDKDIGKGHGKTKRKNYKFWLRKDIQKLARIHNLGLRTYKPLLNIHPSFDDVYYELVTNKNKLFHLDIETNPATGDITVFSFMFEDMDNEDDNTLEKIPIFVVPVWRFNNTLAYDNIARLFYGLYVAMRDNATTGHNISGYDLFILSFKYRIPFGHNNFDTMLAHHRCLPEVEKSLGHCISLYTNQPFHKNDGVFVPHNISQEMKLWVYNGTDVFTTALVRHGILRHARNINALPSIEQVNKQISANLTMTFFGINCDKEAIDEKVKANNARAEQMLRILRILVGRDINPRSYVDMPHYLFEKKDKGGLGLTPVGTTKTGNPSTDAKSLIKLWIKSSKIISLMIIIEYRRIEKETSSLEFEPVCW